MSGSAAEQLNALIRDLETDLGIDANAPLPTKHRSSKKDKSKDKSKAKPAPKPKAANPNQPEITKLDIRVGKIVKVWKHEEADKLYCEEIDVVRPLWPSPQHRGFGLTHFGEYSVRTG